MGIPLSLLLHSSPEMLGTYAYAPSMIFKPLGPGTSINQTRGQTCDLEWKKPKYVTNLKGSTDTCYDKSYPQGLSY